MNHHYIAPILTPMIQFMTIVRKSITFTEQQDSWIKSQIEGGDYTNDSEYIRDLIRKDQANNSKLSKNDCSKRT